MKRATPDLYFGSRLLNTTARRGTDAIVDGARLSHREAIATTDLLAGRYFTPGAPEVVLNEHLARSLRVRPGDRVRVGAVSGPTVTVCATRFWSRSTMLTASLSRLVT